MLFVLLFTYILVEDVVVKWLEDLAQVDHAKLGKRMGTGYV